MLSCLCLFAAASARAQAPPPTATCQPSPTPVVVKPDAAAASASASEAGGIRVFLLGPDKKPLARKRLFLLERSAFSAGGPNWAAMPKRADYLQGASPQLREWLARHDCDSLYCPGLESEFAEAVKTVPEFKRAYDDGLRKDRSERHALKWHTDFRFRRVTSDAMNWVAASSSSPVPPTARIVRYQRAW